MVGVSLANALMPSLCLKMGSCTSTKLGNGTDDDDKTAKDKEKSKLIERQLERDKKDYRATHRLLLLGMYFFYIKSKTKTHLMPNKYFNAVKCLTIIFRRRRRVRKIHYCKANANSSHQRFQRRVWLVVFQPQL